MLYEELERIFKRLEEAGVDSIVMFSIDGRIIKTNMKEEEARFLISVLMNTLKDSTSVIKNLMETRTKIQQIKVISNSTEVNLIVGKKFLLAYRAEKAMSEIYKKFLNLAEKINELYI